MAPYLGFLTSKSEPKPTDDGPLNKDLEPLIVVVLVIALFIMFGLL